MNLFTFAKIINATQPLNAFNDFLPFGAVPILRFHFIFVYFIVPHITEIEMSSNRFNKYQFQFIFFIRIPFYTFLIRNKLLLKKAFTSRFKIQLTECIVYVNVIFVEVLRLLPHTLQQKIRPHFTGHVTKHMKDHATRNLMGGFTHITAPIMLTLKHHFPPLGFIKQFSKARWRKEPCHCSV